MADEITRTILEDLAWAQDPLAICAGQPVIPVTNWAELFPVLVEHKEVTKTESEMLDIFELQAKRFSACGANNSERFAVLRKGNKTGWQYIVDLITAK